MFSLLLASSQDPIVSGHTGPGPLPSTHFPWGNGGFPEAKYQDPPWALLSPSEGQAVRPPGSVTLEAGGTLSTRGAIGEQGDGLGLLASVLADAIAP